MTIFNTYLKSKYCPITAAIASSKVINQPPQFWESFEKHNLELLLQQNFWANFNLIDWLEQTCNWLPLKIYVNNLKIRSEPLAQSSNAVYVITQ